MYSFGPRSKRNLEESHSDLQLVFNAVIKIIDCSVIEGHRPEAEQNKAFADGRSKVEWPGSKHNQSPSLAMDVAPYPIIWSGAGPVNNATALGRFYLLAGIVLGTAEQLWLDGDIAHKVRWGGDWDMDGDILDQSFNDLVHFELRKVT